MKAQTRNAVAAAAVLLALCAVPFLSGKFAVYLTMRIMLLGIFAVGYNLLLGQTGLLSFGHGAFYAAGAYGIGLFGVHVSTHPLLGVVAGVAAAVLRPPGRLPLRPPHGDLLRDADPGVRDDGLP